MPVPNQDHTMFAGETKSFSVPCTNKTTGAALDFAAATATWIVKQDTTTIITKTLVSGITASGGTLTITLATGDTSPYSGKYKHECRAVLADGTKATLWTGTLTIWPTITGV